MGKSKLLLIIFLFLSIPTTVLAGGWAGDSMYQLRDVNAQHPDLTDGDILIWDDALDRWTYWTPDYSTTFLKLDCSNDPLTAQLDAGSYGFTTTGTVDASAHNITDKKVTVTTFTSAGINAAIDALGSESGEVYLPEGEYTLQETITIDYDNTTLTGSGAGTILKADLWANWGGGADHLISGSSKNYVTIQNLTIDGNSANTGQSKDLIRISGTNHRIVNCNLLYADNNAIDHPSGDFFVYANNYISDGDDQVIYIIGGQHGVISDNVIKSTGGIWVNDEHTTIIGNHFESITNTPSLDVDNDYCTIEGNTFESSGSHSIDGNMNYSTIIGNAFYLGANGTNDIFVKEDYNVINGNTCYSTSGYSERAIYLDEADYCIVSGNISVGHDTCGIQIDSDCQNNLVYGNNLQDATPFVNNGTSEETFVVQGDVNVTGVYKVADTGGWSGWFDDGTNFRVTVVGGIITAVDNSTAGGHDP